MYDNKIKDFDSIEESQKIKAPNDIETDETIESQSKKSKKNLVIVILPIFLFVGLIIVLFITRLSKHQESLNNPVIQQQVQQNSQLPQNIANEQKDLNQPIQQNPQSPQNFTNEQKDLNQPIQQSESQINSLNQSLQANLGDALNQTFGITFKKRNHTNISVSDLLPKIRRKSVNNITEILKSKTLNIRDRKITNEYIQFIKPLNETLEAKYKQILFPNLIFDNYSIVHVHNYSMYLSYLKKTSHKDDKKKVDNHKSNKEKDLKKKKEDKNKSNKTKILKKNKVNITKKNNSIIHNKKLNISKKKFLSKSIKNQTLNNSLNSVNNQSLNNSINSVNNETLNNSLNSVNNQSLNNSINSANNQSLSNSTNSATNQTLKNPIYSANNQSKSNTTNNNLTNQNQFNNSLLNTMHGLRSLELNNSSTKYLKDFYLACNRRKLLIVKRNRSEPYEEPIISVIIPFFNKRLELLKTIRSVQLQTLKNIEIIIVDDEAISAKKLYKNILDDDYRIRLFTQNKNLGLWRKRIDGYLYSRGEYILHINPGDILADSFVLEDLYNIVHQYNLDTVRFSFSKTTYDSKFRKNIEFTEKRIYPNRFTKIIYGRPGYNVHIFGYGTIWNRLVRSGIFRKALDLVDEDILNIHKDMWEDMWWNDLVDRVSFSNLVVNRLGYIFLYDMHNIYEPRSTDKYLREKTIREFILFWLFDLKLLPQNNNKQMIIDNLKRYIRPDNKFGGERITLENLIHRYEPYEMLLESLIEDPFVSAENKVFVKKLYQEVTNK